MKFWCTENKLLFPAQPWSQPVTHPFHRRKKDTIYVSPTLETATKIDVTSPVLEGQTPHSTNEELASVSQSGNTVGVKQQTGFKMGSESKDLLLKELTTDSINIHPIKRCAKCYNCRYCKKNHLPDPTRQKEQAATQLHTLIMVYWRNSRPMKNHVCAWCEHWKKDYKRKG